MQKSIEGYTAFMTFTDVFTRWTEAIPVANLSAPDALAALHLFRTRHSLPVTVQVDNHGAFEGEFETYCNNNGVKIKKIESYHAQANARGERPHALIRSKLSAYCSAGKHTLWAQALPFIMEACMTTFNRNIGMTPFQALYGRSHTSSFDLKVGAEFLNITIDQYQDVIHAVQKTLGVRNELASDLQYEYLVELNDLRDRGGHTQRQLDCGVLPSHGAPFCRGRRPGARRGWRVVRTKLSGACANAVHDTGSVRATTA